MVARTKENQGVKGGEHSQPPQYPSGVYPTPPYPPPQYQSGGYQTPPYPPSQYKSGGYQTPPYPPSQYKSGGYQTPPVYKPSYGPIYGYLETPTPEYLEGWVAADILEYGGVKPTTIIRTDSDWSICIYWSLSGVLASMVCGEWCIHAYLESMGPGPELKLPDEKFEVRVPLDCCGDGKYKYEFRIPRGTVREEHCGIPYKLVVSLTYYDNCDRPGPMAGFVELPMLQFYSPGQLKGHDHTHPVPETPNPGQLPTLPPLP